MSEQTLLIVNASVNPNEKEALSTYLDKAGTLFAKAGGKPLGRFKITEHLKGNHTPQMVAVMQFPNSQVIKNVFDSAEYETLIPIRNKAFTELNLFIGIQ